MREFYARYLLRKTKKDYNLIAQDFSITREKEWKELEFLKDLVKEGEKILDIGCGNGRLLKFFHKNIRYFGVDFSENLIEIAKGKYPQANFLVANVLNLPFKDNFFDKVFSIATLHHIPSEKFRLLALKEIKRVLKDGGELILTVWNLRGQIKYMPLILKNNLLKIFSKTKLDFFDIMVPWFQKTNRYYHCFSRGEIKNLVDRAGFQIKEITFLKRNGKKLNIYLRAKKIDASCP